MDGCGDEIGVLVSDVEDDVAEFGLRAHDSGDEREGIVPGGSVPGNVGVLELEQADQRRLRVCSQQFGEILGRHGRLVADRAEGNPRGEAGLFSFDPFRVGLPRLGEGALCLGAGWGMAGDPAEQVVPRACDTVVVVGVVRWNVRGRGELGDRGVAAVQQLAGEQVKYLLPQLVLL